MKLLTVATLFFSLAVISSCALRCRCGRPCSSFNNGTVVTCQESPADSTAFKARTDSLKQLYNDYYPSTTDSLTVTGHSTNSTNIITNQLEKQGYTCDCNYAR